MDKNLLARFTAACEAAQTQEDFTAALMLLPEAPPPSLDSPDPYERLDALLAMPKSSWPCTLEEACFPDRRQDNGEIRPGDELHIISEMKNGR